MNEPWLHSSDIRHPVSIVKLTVKMRYLTVNPVKLCNHFVKFRHVKFRFLTIFLSQIRHNARWLIMMAVKLDMIVSGIVWKSAPPECHFSNSLHCWKCRCFRTSERRWPLIGNARKPRHGAKCAAYEAASERSNERRNEKWALMSLPGHFKRRYSILGLTILIKNFLSHTLWNGPDYKIKQS